MLRPVGPVFQFLGNPLILEFLFGVAIAHAPMRRAALWGIPVGAAALVVVGVAGMAPFGDTIQYLAGEGALWRVLVYGVPAALIVYGTMQIAAKPSVWTYLGDASYSLYLTHPLVVSVLAAVWTAYPVPADLIVAVGMLASLAFAWRVHESVERPLLATLHPTRRRRETSLPA
jgi:exopolysaccharide production protein ExoZ